MNSRRIIALGIALLMLFAGSAAADIYRWVDSQGGVHYSDQPKSGAQSIDVDTGRKARSSGEKAGATSAGRSRAQRAADIRAQECEKAQTRLASYREASTLTRETESGETRELDANERVLALARAEEDVAGLCESGG